MTTTTPPPGLGDIYESRRIHDEHEHEHTPRVCLSCDHGVDVCDGGPCTFCDGTGLASEED